MLLLMNRKTTTSLHGDNQKLWHPLFETTHISTLCDSQFDSAIVAHMDVSVKLGPLHRVRPFLLVVQPH